MMFCFWFFHIFVNFSAHNIKQYKGPSLFLNEFGILKYEYIPSSVLGQCKKHLLTTKLWAETLYVKKECNGS